MKSFKHAAAQGDFVIRRIDKLPAEVEEIKPTNGEHIVAHSETGHHHVITAGRVKAYRPIPDDIFRLFLEVNRLSGEPMPAIRHLRSFDTHEPLQFEAPGVYEIQRHREYTPQGLRRAQD